MDKYDYPAEVTKDIEHWLRQNNFDLSQFENRDEAAEYLHDELWTEDSITGNGGNYYDSAYKCGEYLCHNLDILLEALLDYDLISHDLYRRIDVKEFSQWADCAVRCYLLENAIENALIKLENDGLKYKETNDEYLLSRPL